MSISPEDLQGYLRIVAEATRNEVVTTVSGERAHPLLPKTEEELFRFWNAGGSALAILNGEVVGHATIEPLSEGWYEIGAVWVRKDLRGGQGGTHHHVGYRLYKALLERHHDKFLITTTITPAIIVLGLRVGMVPVRYENLPREAWQATCVCPVEKTGVERYENVPSCKIKNTGCIVLVSQEAWRHIGQPEPHTTPVQPQGDAQIPQDDIEFFFPE